MSVTAIVLAGGRSRRFGSDKLAADLNGTTVLDRLLAGLPAFWPIVLVGPCRTVCREVTWVRESPPGGGPLAGVAAGTALVTTDVTVVVAGDMPWAAPLLPLLAETLAQAAPGIGAVVGRDGEGQANPLLAAYRTAAVRAHVPTPAHDRPAKLLLDIPHVELDVDPRAASDVDTPADLARMAAWPRRR